MTEQVVAPLTRRALRAAIAVTSEVQEASATRPSFASEVTTPTDPAPMTRRALREAERARASRAGAEAQDDGTGAAPTSAEPRTAWTTVPSQPSAPRLESTSSAPVTTAEPSRAAGRPLTRRELRLAAQVGDRRLARTDGAAPKICRPPFAASLVVPAEQVRASKVRGSQVRAVASRLGTRPLVVVALSVSVLVGGMTQVHAEQRVVAEQQAAAAEEARVERVGRVTSARHAAQAAAIAADRRTEAIAAAEAAVSVAQGVQERSAQVVDAAMLASLEAAAAQLTDLLDAAPAVEALSAAATAATEHAGDAPADDAAGDTPSSTAAVTSPGESTDVSDATGQPAAAGADRTLGTQPASRSGAGDAGRVPVSERAGAAAGAALGATDVGVLEERLAALDIGTSERILEAAAEVAELSSQVEATAQVIIAEEEARQAAEAAAREAAEAEARRVAAELARKVAAVADSPNGQIPADLLCGVAFQDGVQLRCDAAAALEEVNAAYRAAFGRDLEVVSSYRSYSRQISVRQSRGYLAAQPGTSNHGHAIAVDLGNFGGVGDFSSANYRWMRDNGPAFGWHHPEIMRPGGGGPQEPWHFEFTG